MLVGSCCVLAGMVQLRVSALPGLLRAGGARSVKLSNGHDEHTNILVRRCEQWI